jgi:hypothetical protein
MALKLSSVPIRKPLLTKTASPTQVVLFSMRGPDRSSSVSIALDCISPARTEQATTLFVLSFQGLARR